MNTQLAVIIPVYSGFSEVVGCIESVIYSRNTVDVKVIVIYDCGPDESIERYLGHLFTEGKIQLYKNVKNLGFVKTVNRGFSITDSHDCVILNSDTLVPDGWADRLVDLAASDTSIATITPFTNNGEICSFPNFCEDNQLPLGMNHKAVDKVFIDEMPEDAIDVPTGVGFCMYIRRNALEKTGYFDADIFERGYGEENDLCFRFSEAGFRNVVCTNLFVYHSGGVSFGDEKFALMEAGSKQLNKRYPSYGLVINQFINADPLKAYRFKALLGVFKNSPKPLILIASHGRGGGADKYIDDLKNYYEGQANFIVVEAGSSEQCVITFPQWTNELKLNFDFEKDKKFLTEMLSSLHPDLFHINHLKGLERHIDWLISICQCPYVIALHDYNFISANPTLTDSDGRFSMMSIESQKSFEKDVNEGSDCNLEEWKDLTSHVLSGAAYIIAPSVMVCDLYQRVFPDIEINVHEHVDAELIGRYPPVRVRQTNTNAPLRIAILGALGKEKGADVLEAVAKLAKKQGLNFEFILVGYAYRPLSNIVHTTGPYENAQLKNLIEKYEPDFIWFPSLCAETYSYTLSFSMEMAIPVLVNDLGALFSRTHNRPFSKVVSHTATIEEWLAEIISFGDELRGNGGAVASWGQQPPKGRFYIDEYLQLVRAFDQSIEGFPLPSLADIESALDGQTAPEGGSKLLKLLIRLRLNRNLYWLSRIVPYSLQRKVKRYLSIKPVHRL